MAFAVDVTKDVWVFIARLLLALVCGFIIGLERKTRSKEAGVRTHAIVCMASALFMILSKNIANDAFGGSGFSADATRIAAAGVQGIGFLGAGIIMYRRDVMHGLTTAAGVWATAAIGMAIGSGFIVIGVISTVLLLVLQLIFHLPMRSLVTRHLTILKLRLWLETEQTLDDIVKGLGNGRVTSYEVKSENGKMIAFIEFTSLNHFTFQQMNALILSDPQHILSVESNIE